MKESSFETIRWIFWPGILIALALAGCGPSAVTPTPTITPAANAVTAPATTLTISPTVQHNTLTFEPTPTSTSKCPPYTSVSAIIQRDDNTGWRHYWASSSQKIAINSLAFDGRWLWIATEKGILRLDPSSLEYKLLASTGTSPDIALDQVYTLAVDDQGRLWAGGEEGLVRYSEGTGWKVIRHSAVTSFAIDKAGNLWYWYYYVRSGRPSTYRLQGQEPPPTGDWIPEWIEWKEAYLDPANWRLLALESRLATGGDTKDASGNTWSWVKTKSLLTVYYNGELVHEVPTYYRGYNVAVTQTGMWIAVEHGLLYSDGQTLKPYRLTAGKAVTNYPRVESLAFTGDGSGWTTTSQGLFHFSAEAGTWEPITETSITRSPEEEKINLVASTRQNSLWAYGNDYLAHFDGQSWKRWSTPDNLNMNWTGGAVIDSQDDFWFVSYGLWRFDGQTWENISTKNIIGLAQDHDGKLYTMTNASIKSSYGPVVVYDRVSWQALSYCTECGRPILGSLAVDATGKVWVAYEYGIWLHASNEGWCRILEYQQGDWIVGPPLTDARGDFWFNFKGASIIRCNLGNCELWDLRDDYWVAPITAMAMDSQGRIWVGGYGLLSVYDPSAER